LRLGPAAGARDLEETISEPGQYFGPALQRGARQVLAGTLPLEDVISSWSDTEEGATMPIEKYATVRAISVTAASPDPIPLPAVCDPIFSNGTLSIIAICEDGAEVPLTLGGVDGAAPIIPLRVSAIRRVGEVPGSTLGTLYAFYETAPP